MVQEIETTVDAENIEYKLFVNKDQKWCIRVRDLDAEENVSLTIYPTAEKAVEVFYSGKEVK